LLTANGDAYVSDSFQGIIWRVRPSTRTYEVWLAAEALVGNPFSPFPAGANGLAKGPDGYLYIANTTAGPSFGGALYRVPMLDAPGAHDIELVTAWTPFNAPGVPFPLPQGPDGLRFDVQGNLWVTLAFANTIAKLTMSSGEVVGEQRFTHQPTSGVPFNQPSELHLDSRSKRAFVANHALEPPTPSHWVLFEMQTSARGAPLEKPWVGWSCQVDYCYLNIAELDAHLLSLLVIEDLLGL
jgi:sugar lactone lactonase YvrE